MMLTRAFTRPGRILLVAAAVLALALGLAALLALGHGGGSPLPVGASAPPTAAGSRPADDVDAATTPDGDLSPIPATSDAEAFTRDVAAALFDWDTAAGVPLAKHRGRLLAVADPTGVESPGLVSDLTVYLPTEDTWATLRPYATRQWIEISSVVVPSLWPQALAEGGDQLAPGTTAYTVTGVRHRTGTDKGKPLHVELPITFTVFAICGPTYPQCHLLRLSQLDNPLR